MSNQIVKFSAARLLEARKSVGMSRPDVLSEMESRDCEFGMTSLRMIEGGKRSVRIDEALFLCEIYGIRVESIFTKVPSSNRELISEARSLIENLTEISKMLEYSASASDVQERKDAKHALSLLAIASELLEG